MSFIVTTVKEKAVENTAVKQKLEGRKNGHVSGKGK
jgi:hypothetical protein